MTTFDLNSAISHNDDLSKTNITYKELMIALSQKHHDLYDSVGIKVYDENDNELYFCDCMEEEGIEESDLSNLYVVKVEYTNDFYSCGEYKRGYLIYVKN